MIKCPKCNFEQPTDQYCANCGVNMETYKPQSPPLWKRLAFNWMAQLGLLIVIILGVVFYDGGQDRSTTQVQQVSTTYIESKRNQQKPQMQQASVARPQPTESKPNKKDAARLRRLKRAQRLQQEAAPAAAAPQEKTASVPKPSGIRVSFYSISQRAFTEMQRANPESFSYSGYMAGGILEAATAKELMNSADMEPLSANRFKEFNASRPINIFKGKRTERGANVGLNFMLTPDLQTGNRAQIKVEGWHALKEEDGEVPIFAGDMTLVPSKIAFFTSFLPRDLTFTEDEKDLLESDRVLQIMNSPEFAEDRVDLIMFIELTQ